MHATLTYPTLPGGRLFTRGNVRGYCFGFNGKEKVDEVYGDANAYDFGARLYDPRLGRWLAVDPQSDKQPGWSSYKAFLDNPIVYVDPDGGLEILTVIVRNTTTGKTTTHFVVTKGKYISKQVDVRFGKKYNWHHYNRTMTVDVNDKGEYSNMRLGEPVAVGAPVKQTMTNRMGEENMMEGHKPRGGMWIFSSDGTGRDIGPGDNGDPSHMFDFAELSSALGIFGPESPTMETFEWLVRKISKSPDTEDFLTVVNILDKALGMAEKGQDIGEIIHGLKEDYDRSKRMEKYNEPDSVNINTPTGGPDDWVKRPAREGEKDGDSIIVNQ